MIKALGLLSGGLDSMLAAKLMKDQGIEVIALNFITPFIIQEKGKNYAKIFTKKLKIPLKVVKLENEYIRLIRKPKYGYGKFLNPCIDCRIFMLKKAKKYAKKINASFIFTGEVLNERPMSQTRKALEIIEREAGLKGKILRPLSAKLLPPTEAEKKGVVRRERLLDISGKGRKKQIELAKKFKIKEFSSPAGGCLLTYKEFSAKLKDLFKHKKRIRMKDIELLKVGRHFRFGKNKIIVGRNEKENKQLLELKSKTDYFFEVPDCGSPITLLQGSKTREAIKKAAALTARYSDAKEKKILVKYGMRKLTKSIKVFPISKKKINSLRVKW